MSCSWEKSFSRLQQLLCLDEGSPDSHSLLRGQLQYWATRGCNVKELNAYGKRLNINANSNEDLSTLAACKSCFCLLCFLKVVPGRLTLRPETGQRSQWERPEPESWLHGAADSYLLFIRQQLGWGRTDWVRQETQSVVQRECSGEQAKAGSVTRSWLGEVGAGCRRRARTTAAVEATQLNSDAKVMLTFLIQSFIHSLSESFYKYWVVPIICWVFWEALCIQGGQDGQCSLHRLHREAWMRENEKGYLE